MTELEKIKARIEEEIDKFIIILTETKFIVEEVAVERELENLSAILADNLKNFVTRMRDHLYDLKATTR